MLSTQQIEEIFTPFLQKDIEFLLEDKVIKSGKLVLFSIKGFYYTFTLSIDGKGKLITFELPYSFTFYHSGDTINFGYKVKDLFQNNTDAKCRSLFYTYKKSLRYLDNEIILQTKN